MAVCGWVRCEAEGPAPSLVNVTPAVGSDCSAVNPVSAEVSERVSVLVSSLSLLLLLRVVAMRSSVRTCGWLRLCTGLGEQPTSHAGLAGASVGGAGASKREQHEGPAPVPGFGAFVYVEVITDYMRLPHFSHDHTPEPSGRYT